MATIKDFIQKRPLIAYFVLAFVISWGGVFLAGGGASGMPKTPEEFSGQLPIFIPSLLAGPSLGCILVTALTSGRAGFRDLGARVSNVRAGFRWYAAALLTAPLVWSVQLLALALFSTAFVPAMLAAEDKASLLIMGVGSGLVVGFFEELGWTGFAIPKLRQRYSVLTSGLIVGVLWGAWHVFLNAFWVNEAFRGGLSSGLFIAEKGLMNMVGLLPAYRILMVWVYDRSGSLPVAMLMHASLLLCTMTLDPAAISGLSMVTYDVVAAGAMWIMVAVIALATRGGLRSQIGPVAARAAD